MNRQIWQVAAILVCTVASTSVQAKDWGTVDGAHLCDKELAAAKASANLSAWINEAVKTNKGLSPECKKELDKRSQLCLEDPGMSGYLNNRDITRGDPDRVCREHAFSGMGDQIENAEREKQREAVLAKEREEAKAKEAERVAAIELPKAEMHDAKLEKAVAEAYKRDYEGTVQRVILGGWSTDYEKDAFGRVNGRDLDATVVNKQPDGTCQLHSELWLQHGNGRSFSGPLSARGAGSAKDEHILCSKVEGAASPAATGGKTKKK